MGQCEHPSLVTRKLIAMAQCFEGDLPSYLQREENVAAKIGFLFGRAVKHLKGVRNEFVPQVFGSQDQMIEALRGYAREWSGLIWFSSSAVFWDLATTIRQN